jgi:hypothetical protein
MKILKSVKVALSMKDKDDKDDKGPDELLR